MHPLRAVCAGGTARHGEGQEALRRSHARALALAAAALLVLPATAHAAKAELVQNVVAEQCGAACPPALTPNSKSALYTAAAGEANAAVMTVSGSELVIADPGATITVGDGCRSIDEHTAACSGFVQAVAELGDRDDSVDMSALQIPAFANGGDGADRLTGGSGADGLNGGSGADTLLGGPGDDRLAPDDAAGGFADVVDGGAGADIVDYSGRKDPLTVDLSSSGPVQGSAGEGDRFTSVEGVLGGSASDVLLGSGGRDQIDGGAGRDRIEARGGNDIVEVRDQQPDRVSCGRGSDIFTGHVPGTTRVGESTLPDATDLIGSDCESVWFGAQPRPVHLLSSDRRSALFSRPCTKAGDRFSLRITTASRVLGATPAIRCDAAGDVIRVKLRGARAGMVVTLHWRINGTRVAWRTVLP